GPRRCRRPRSPAPPALPATRPPGTGAARAGVAQRSPRARASPACWWPLASLARALSRQRRGDPRGGAVGATGLLDVDPVDTWLAREPGPLPLGIAHSVALHEPQGLRGLELAARDPDELAIADRRERRQRRTVALREQALDLAA